MNVIHRVHKNVVILMKVGVTPPCSRNARDSTLPVSRRRAERLYTSRALDSAERHSDGKSIEQTVGELKDLSHVQPCL